MNTNGVVSFGGRYTNTGSSGSDFSNVFSPPIIAPFWDDINVNNGGTIYYRQNTDSAVTEMVRQEILFGYPEVGPFTAELVFVATWDRVAAFNSDFSGLVNTFQVVLVSDGDRSFVRFNYGDIQWGGRNTLIGISAGDGFRYITYSPSLSSSIPFIDNTSVSYRIDGEFVAVY